MFLTSSSLSFLHQTRKKMNKQKMRTTNPRRMPAMALTTTSLEPASAAWSGELLLWA